MIVRASGPAFAEILILVRVAEAANVTSKG